MLAQEDINVSSSPTCSWKTKTKLGRTFHSKQATSGSVYFFFYFFPLTLPQTSSESQCAVAGSPFFMFRHWNTVAVSLKIVTLQGTRLEKLKIKNIWSEVFYLSLENHLSQCLRAVVKTMTCSFILEMLDSTSSTPGELCLCLFSRAGRSDLNISGVNTKVNIGIRSILMSNKLLQRFRFHKYIDVVEGSFFCIIR